MIHNGIEHGTAHAELLTHNRIGNTKMRSGMMSAQAEAWQIMSLGLGLTYGKGLRLVGFTTKLTLLVDEIGDEFARWNTNGELVHKLLMPGFHPMS